MNYPLAPDASGRSTGEKRYRWVMLALLWLAYFIFGLVSASLAPLVTPIIADLNISYSQMGIIMGAYSLAYVAVASVAGIIIDRWGVRKSIFVGIAFIGLSEFLRFFAGGFGTMFLCVALFGLGGPMISVGSPKTCAMWFRGRQRGTAVGVYLTGVWIGQAITLTTMNSVIMPLAGFNWRLAFAALGIVAFAAALLWWALARDAKPADALKSLPITRVFRGLISIKNVKLVIILGVLSFAVGYGFNSWLPKILEAGGLSPATAGFTASIPIWVGIPTVAIVPGMVPAHQRGRVLAIVSLMVTVAILMVGLTTGAPRIIGLVMYGVAYCCALPLLLIILMELPEVGSKYLGSVSGVFFCLSELGGFLGPMMVGAVKDLAGSFMAGAFVLAGISLVRVGFALWVKTRRTRDPAASK